MQTQKPLSKRKQSVVDKILKEWEDGTGEVKGMKLPSRHQITDRVMFYSMPDSPDLKTFPGLPAKVIAVHFYPGKVKYDLDLLFAGNQHSRIYNVDSVLVEPTKV